MHLLKGREMNELTNPLTPTLGSQSYKDRRDCSSHLHGMRRISGPDWVPDTISYLAVTITMAGCCTFQQHKPLPTYSAVGSVLLRGQAVNIHRTATQEISFRTFLEILASLLFLPAFSLLSLPVFSLL